MAIELAKAYVQILPSAEGIKGNLENIMNGEADKAGKSAGSKLSSGIGSALAGGAAVIGAGMTAAVGAIGSLSKSALSAFANYEQLTGGVETLFKDSSDIVMKYAEDAYKTSGLSANEYMKTVTSFSASLLQSLDGDTEAAAQYAQTAIVDMSDNANKMGTSMESVQNAYQGFAKQNFTMLDNLKLGYGGTKAEMERLLEDAMEISGVEYDISSYADIVAAIHVVQKELRISGITAEEAAEAVANGTMTEEEAFEAMGTTAKEASTTISGSVASMKSAWTNFLTSMNGSPDQIQKSTDALVNSVVTTANNIIPKLTSIIPNVINGIGTLVQSLMPQIPAIINTLLPALIEGASSLMQQLVSILPDILASLSAVIPDLINAIMTMMPMLLEAALEIMMALGQGLIESIPVLIPAAVDMLFGLIDGILENLDMIIGLAIDLMTALALGLVDAIPKLIEKIPDIIIGLVDALLDPDNIAKLMEASVQIIIGLVTGLVSAIPKLIEAIPKILKAIVDGLRGGIDKIKEIGPDLVAGLWNGIKGAWDSLVSNVKGLGSKLLSGIKDVFGIHSPSTEFAEIGEMCHAGLDNGLSGIEETVADTKNLIADEMNDSFSMNAALNIQRNIGQAGSLRTPAPGGNDTARTIAGAVYEALSNMTLAASIEGKPTMKKFFDEMRIEAKLYKNRTGQEAFV